MLYSIFQKLFYKNPPGGCPVDCRFARPALCLLRFAGRILFRLYRFSHAYHPVFPNDCHVRAAASGRFYTVRIFPAVPAQTASLPWYSSWSVYAFLQYADHERRCAPDLRSVFLCCTGTAAGSIRQKTPDARCLPADYCRQPRQHADSHREPSEFISVWQKPTVLFRFFAAHAPLYAAVCHPAFCLHFLSGTSASAANSLFLNPESDYKRCTKKSRR